jgi:hypothetical protein
VRDLWIFLHLFGFTMWIGGGLGAMFVSIANKAAPRDQLGTVGRTLSAVYLRVIAPGAALVVISGMVLTMQLMSAIGSGGGGSLSPWLMTMQGAGLVGAALVLIVMLPAASRIGRVDPVANAPAFDALRSRLRSTGFIAGLLGFIALLGGAFYR